MGYFGNPDPQGITSTVNSSTVPLTDSTTFTGTAELNDYPDVMISTFTDTSGILYVEFSPNGTDWDTSLSFPYTTDTIQPPHVFVKGNRYFRIRFTNNSGSNQVEFRLYTYYGNFQKLTSPINGVIAQQFDALATRPTNFELEIAEGIRQGIKSWGKFGYRDTSDTNESIISPGDFGSSYARLSSAEQFEVKSSDINDSSAGTGARTIKIQGINDTAEIEEVLEMNGTTGVTTVNSYIGINRVSVVSAGSSTFNEGDISITSNGGANLEAFIPSGVSVTQQLLYHVIPSTDTFIYGYKFTPGTIGSKATDFTIKGYYVLNGVRYTIIDEIVQSSSNSIHKFTIPFKIPNGSYWYLTEVASSINASKISVYVDQISIRLF